MKLQKSRAFKLLCEEIQDTEEQILAGNIEVITLKSPNASKDDSREAKIPIVKWKSTNPCTPKEIFKHYGNFGIKVGYKHEENGHSLASVDIDGFKYWRLPKKYKDNMPKESKAYFESLTQEEQEEIALQTKQDIMEILKNEFPKGLFVNSQSGGYHIYINNKIWNEQEYPGIKQNDVAHKTSQQLHFPNDYHIKELQGVSLGNSMEIFTTTNKRYMVLPGSSIRLLNQEERKYTVSPNSPVNRWQDIGIIENLNKTVKEAFINAGYTWKEEQYNSNISIIDAPGNSEHFEDFPTLEAGNIATTKTTKTTPTTPAGSSGEWPGIGPKLINEVSKKLKELFKHFEGWSFHKDLSMAIGTLFYKCQLNKEDLESILTLAYSGTGAIDHYEHRTQIILSYDKTKQAMESGQNVELTGFPTIEAQDPNTGAILTNQLLELLPGKKEYDKQLNKQKNVKVTSNKQTKQQKQLEEEEELLEYLSQLNERRNPTYDQERAKHIENLLIRKAEQNKENPLYLGALFEYLDDQLQYLMVGTKQNVHRLFLGEFNIARGHGSYYLKGEGDSGTGKSYEMEVALSLIPGSYILKINNITFASLTRAGEDGKEHCYERVIIYLGDIGNAKDIEDFGKINKVFDILITEKEYGRNFRDTKNNKADDSNLIAESIGCGFTTTKSGPSMDKQVQSRSIEYMSSLKNQDDQMDFKSKIRTSTHPKTIKKQLAEEEINTNFLEYVKYKINDKTEVIGGHFKTVFQKMSKEAQVPIREFDQLLELFEAYCTLTSYNCKPAPKGELLATETQLYEFINTVCLESTMNPKHFNLLQLLKFGSTKAVREMKKAPKDRNQEFLEQYKYKICYFEEAEEETKEQETTEETKKEPQEPNEKIITFKQMYDTTMTFVNVVGDAETFEDLTNIDKPKFINRFMKEYRIKKGTGGYVFTISDVTALFRGYKAFKDIDNLGEVLNDMYLNDYLGKLEFKDTKGQNIYYLTRKAEQAGNPITITEKDRQATKNWLLEMGEDYASINIKDSRITKLLKTP